ncbi:MAG TPA: hypothetical protein VMW19_10555 [Myxococcota bacterium]|nr:hypothetical protein [Myxococcota bacterium]
MSALFIDVKVEPQAARDPALAKKLAEACPVDIFEATPGGVRIVEKNLDECVLCDLCVQAAPPGAVKIVKLYEQEASR